MHVHVRMVLCVTVLLGLPFFCFLLVSFLPSPFPCPFVLILLRIAESATRRLSVALLPLISLSFALYSSYIYALPRKCYFPTLLLPRTAGCAVCVCGLRRKRGTYRYKQTHTHVAGSTALSAPLPLLLLLLCLSFFFF